MGAILVTIGIFAGFFFLVILPGIKKYGKAGGKWESSEEDNYLLFNPGHGLIPGDEDYPGFKSLYKKDS